jgi:hypothetical protein
MKKAIAVMGLILALAVVGCKTTGTATSDPTKGPTNEKAADKVTIIDHMYRGEKNMPAWVTMNQGELDNMAEFKGSITFKEVFQSKDLNVAKTMADDFNVGAQLSKYISNRIQTKFSGALVGSNDGSDVYFEKIVKSMADAQVSGSRRYADYWLLRRYINDDKTTRDVYEYYVLVQVPKAEVKKAAARVIDLNAPKSDDEKRARDKVKKVMDEEEEW